MVRDHVHMLIKIPPKYKVSEVIGYINLIGAVPLLRSFQFTDVTKNFGRAVVTH